MGEGAFVHANLRHVRSVVQLSAKENSKVARPAAAKYPPMRWQFRTGTILIQASNREAKIRGVVAGTRWRECLASDGTWLHIVPVPKCPSPCFARHGIARSMNSSNSGTVNAMSPWAGL